MNYFYMVSAMFLPFAPLLSLLPFAFPDFKDYLGLGPAEKFAHPIIIGLSFLFLKSPILWCGALSLVSLAVPLLLDRHSEFPVSIWWVIGYLITQTAAGSYTPYGWYVGLAAVCYIRWLIHGPWILCWAPGDMLWMHFLDMSVSYCSTMETNFSERSIDWFLDCCSKLWDHLCDKAWQYHEEYSRKIDVFRKTGPASFNAQHARFYARLTGYLDLADELVIKAMKPFKISPRPAPVRPEEPAVVAPVEDPAPQEDEEEEREAEHVREARVRQEQERQRQVVASERKLPPAQFTPVRLVHRCPPPAVGSVLYPYSGSRRMLLGPSYPLYRPRPRGMGVPQPKPKPGPLPPLVPVEVVAAQMMAQRAVLAPQPVPTYQPVAGPQYVPAPQAGLVPEYAPVALEQQVAAPQPEFQVPQQGPAVFDYHAPANLSPLPPVTVAVDVDDLMDIDDPMDIDGPMDIGDLMDIDGPMQINDPSAMEIDSQWEPQEKKAPGLVIAHDYGCEAQGNEFLGFNEPMLIDGPEDDVNEDNSMDIDVPQMAIDVHMMDANVPQVGIDVQMMDIDVPQVGINVPEEEDSMQIDVAPNKALSSLQEAAAAASAALTKSMQGKAPAPAPAPVQKQPPPLLTVEFLEQAPTTEIPGLVHQQPQANATSLSLPWKMFGSGSNGQKAKETSSPKSAGPQNASGLGPGPTPTSVQGQGQSKPATAPPKKKKRFTESVHLPAPTTAPAEASSSKKPTPACLPGLAASVHSGGKLESNSVAGKSAASGVETHAARPITYTDEAQYEDAVMDAVEEFMQEHGVDEETARAEVLKRMGPFSG
ncbi:uncharacterized protein F4807DRAFT_464716 [Annulohypoxylon truncatum]|uniref:uncharacterized protein n=1 Tax=Annulohypoxylon truncatum TaxID=327061 RepID=UPI002008D0CD|nr:uncharacterized protein F4807DRAFT_464716 [Annulohypoxylon truncatum]KAI1205430.1 hypothetical protein F4807DRAFT_464716 [Annulohypoxylon truncatum]